MMWTFERVLMFLVIVNCIFFIRGQFFECHMDPTDDPEDGPLRELQFTWLGALQYIHVKNGTPHYYRVPRVVLISRQFALSTAIDAAQIPEGYALGNIAFGDYERDERECGVSIEEIAAGAECEPAILLMPIADVLLHPEYKHFGAKDSLAILKTISPLRSGYVIPVCLPFKNYLITKSPRQSPQKLFHVDFGSDVPRDFVAEEKEVTRLSLLPRELCYLYDNPDNGTKLMKNRMACTTGCGFHSGAPTLVHEHTGHWSIVALSQGGSPCPDPLRVRRPPPPPRHILLHPYVPWITAAITGKAVGAFAKDDPFEHDLDIFCIENISESDIDELIPKNRMKDRIKFKTGLTQFKNENKSLKTCSMDTESVDSDIDVNSVASGSSSERIISVEDVEADFGYIYPNCDLELFRKWPLFMEKALPIYGKIRSCVDILKTLEENPTEGFIMPRNKIFSQDSGHAWVGHWWMGGFRCHDRGEAADDMFRFYHEIFQVKPTTPTYLSYYLEVDAMHDTLIICVKVGMPYKMGQPRVWELDTPVVKVRVPTIAFRNLYKFQVEVWGYNASETSTSSVESTSEESYEEAGYY